MNRTALRLLALSPMLAWPPLTPGQRAAVTRPPRRWPASRRSTRRTASRRRASRSRRRPRSRVLQHGGNAIDAAVTAAAVLAVVEPMMTGIGGDMFALIWSAKEKKLVALNASGRAGRDDA